MTILPVSGAPAPLVLAVAATIGFSCTGCGGPVAQAEAEPSSASRAEPLSHLFGQECWVTLRPDVSGVAGDSPLVPGPGTHYVGSITGGTGYKGTLLSVDEEWVVLNRAQPTSYSNGKPARELMYIARPTVLHIAPGSDFYPEEPVQHFGR